MLRARPSVVCTCLWASVVLSCVGAADPCGDCSYLDSACLEGVCNEESGVCETTTLVSWCDDGNPCTAGDSCRSDGSCVGKPACPPLSVAVWGEGSTTPRVGSAVSDATYDDYCPAGSFLIGFTPYVYFSAATVWGLEPICDFLEPGRDGVGSLSSDIYVREAALPQRGIGTAADELRCYGGQVVVGIAGRSSERIDQLSVVCADARIEWVDGEYALGFADPTRTPPTPGSQGTPFGPTLCPAGMVAHGVSIGMTGDGVDALRLFCRPLHLTFASIANNPFDTTQIGTPSSTRWDDECRLNRVVAGFRAELSNGNLRSIGLACSRLELVDSPLEPTAVIVTDRISYQATVLASSSTRDREDHLCPYTGPEQVSRQVAHGWRLAWGDTSYYTGLQLRCRTPVWNPADGVLAVRNGETTLPRAGAGLLQPATIACGDVPMIGFFGTTSGWGIRSLGARCANVVAADP